MRHTIATRRSRVAEIAAAGGFAAVADEEVYQSYRRTLDLVNWIGMREGMLDVEPRAGVDELARLDLAVVVDGAWSRRNVESSARSSHRRRQ